MHRGYRDLSRLVLQNAAGEDYEIEYRVRSGDLTVVAIHGGGIQPLTSELARAIAGSDYTLFEFRGMRRRNNAELYVSSLRFDEIRLRGLLMMAGTAVSIHGAKGEARRVHVGGGNENLALCISEHLAGAGFEMGRGRGALRGRHPGNLVNRHASDKGVQLVLTRGLRDSMVEGGAAGLARRDPEQRTEAFSRFVGAIRSAIERYLTARLGDLDKDVAEAARIVSLLHEEAESLPPQAQGTQGDRNPTRDDEARDGVVRAPDSRRAERGA